MKLPSCLAACLLTASAAFASDVPQFEITARYQGFDPSAAPRVTTPRVTTIAGQRATVEITREVPVPGGTEDGKATVNSGVILDVSPTLKDGKIMLTGRSIVRQRLEPGKQPLDAVSFNTRETFFSGEVTDGKPLTIQTGDNPKDNAQVTLTVTRVEPSEVSHVRHDSPPKYRVYAIEPSPEEARKPIYKILGAVPAEAVDGNPKLIDDSPSQSNLAVAGIFQPAEQSNSMLLQVKNSLRELPPVDQPVTISSALGEDGRTLDWKIQSLGKSAHPVSTELSTWWGSDIYLVMADSTRPGGRRGLLIRQE